MTGDHPIQVFLKWFDAQGGHVRGHAAIVGMAVLPQARPADRDVLADIAEVARSEQAFREWLTANARNDRLAQFGKLLFVRSLFSLLMFRYGHEEGRQATQARVGKIANYFDSVAKQETDISKMLRGDPANLAAESDEWSAAAASWKTLCNTSLSDEALEGRLVAFFC